MTTPRIARYAFLLIVPFVLWAAVQPQPEPARCSEDTAVPAGEEHAALWSALGGKASFDRDEAPFVRLTFKADPAYLRFDRDASLRVRVAPLCRTGDHIVSIDFDLRFSAGLRHGAELADVMLLGKKAVMLPGAGVPAPGQWTRVRIPIPADAGAFEALHFGAGAAWARERPGEEVTMDVRNVVARRTAWTHPTLAAPLEPQPVRRDPDDPEGHDPRPVLGLAAALPAWAVVDFPGDKGGVLRLEGPFAVTAWRADWRGLEIKPGVVRREAIRLLRYDGGRLGAPGEPHRFWLRIGITPKTQVGVHELAVRLGARAVTYAVEVFPAAVTAGTTTFVMYYQMNRNWPAYPKHANFFENAPGHFAQLAELGFTGVHLADEPVFDFNGQRITANLMSSGRYWQNWPSSPASLAAAARSAGLVRPLVWEGLRIFGRDEVWASIAHACDLMPDPGDRRFATLASAAVPLWQKAIGAPPLLSIDDEPGTKSADAVKAAELGLRSLRAAGFQTYLTTHARQHDSFHKLAPLLDVNALHAEDVTAGAAAFVRSMAGKLWLYNGGSFNTSTPGQDRFFTGVYGWLAGAEGLAQWIYTRPSLQADALELQTRLRDDAQFYALPGEGNEPAATPGLLGLAMGISDRRLIEAAEKTAQGREVLARLRSELPLPKEPSEYTPARLARKVDLHGVRMELLRALGAPRP